MALKPSYAIPALPPKAKLETIQVLKLAAIAHRHLAELKGKCSSIPNARILIDTLMMQEAKASSEVENIITTQEEVFQTSLFPENPASPAAKEVALYRQAVGAGFDHIRQQKGLLTNNTIISMFQILKRTDGAFRETPGTALLNEADGRLVYVPPQDPREVRECMGRLEKFINDDQCDLDPLIKMAIIHHQFESIHPFPDGNGRIGRIINVLYLTQQGLLDIPILYLSRYITGHKGDYYKYLQSVRDDGNWEPWLLYMLRAVADTAVETLRLVEAIRQLMADYKVRIRSNHRRIYSQELLNTLFRHPYTRIEFLVRELDTTRQTAAKYLDELADAGLLTKHRIGKYNYYMNPPLVALFYEVSSHEEQSDTIESAEAA